MTREGDGAARPFVLRDYALLADGERAALVGPDGNIAGSPGLYTEEFDVAQRQLRGNLPQTFVHALLIEAAAALAGA